MPPKFNGLENAYLFLSEFEEVCNMTYFHSVQINVVKMTFIPFALKDNVKWLTYSLHISNWDDFIKIFLRKYFLNCKTGKLRNEIVLKSPCQRGYACGIKLKPYIEFRLVAPENQLKGLTIQQPQVIQSASMTCSCYFDYSVNSLFWLFSEHGPPKAKKWPVCTNLQAKMVELSKLFLE